MWKRKARERGEGGSQKSEGGDGDLSIKRNKKRKSKRRGKKRNRKAR